MSCHEVREAVLLAHQSGLLLSCGRYSEILLLLLVFFLLIFYIYGQLILPCMAMVVLPRPAIVTLECAWLCFRKPGNALFRTIIRSELYCVSIKGAEVRLALHHSFLQST